MYAYCGNNPVNRVDFTGRCYFDANGNWCHDNWEYIGGYQRKPSPVIEKQELSCGTLIVVDSSKMGEREAASYLFPNLIIARDSRKCKDGCQGDCNPNMQLVNSYRITETSYIREILTAMCEYDKRNPSTHTWGRTVDSMVIEWAMHAGAHTFIRTSRLAHTDFDADSEEYDKLDYIILFLEDRYVG